MAFAVVAAHSWLCPDFRGSISEAIQEALLVPCATHNLFQAAFSKSISLLAIHHALQKRLPDSNSLAVNPFFVGVHENIIGINPHPQLHVPF